ncbi:MAG: hypothetical protein ACKOTB_00580 [Planctomycetia bacterium]
MVNRQHPPPAAVAARGRGRAGIVGRLRIALAAFGIVVLTGCGGPLPKTAPVTGMVMLGGEPLAGATVIFSTVGPVEQFGRLIATGQTGPDGRFSVVTRVGAEQSATGAAVGEHRVTVSVFGPPDGLTEQAYQAQLDAHQKAVDTKGFSGAGEPPKPRVSRLKPQFSDAAKTPLTVTVVGGKTNEFTFAVE